MISVFNVHFSYNGEPALSRVYFKIFPLDLVSLIGPNGGGKTTLFRLLLGLLKPDRGAIRVFGQPPERVRTRMGYVPQYSRFDPLFPISVKDVVAMGRVKNAPTGPYRAEDRAAALAALEEVGLADLRSRPFSDLSGGQRQRVLIARALAGAAQILLLDEPTAGVDRHMERGLTDLLHRLNERIPIVMVSHDVSFVSTHLKRVACLNRTLTCHRADEVSEQVIAEMYEGRVRVVHHEESCPLADPGCDHGCLPQEARSAHVERPSDRAERGE